MFLRWGETGLVLEAVRHDAFVQLERVAVVVNVEQLGGQRVAAVVALALG
jgi:hypothetical protein